MKTFLTDAARDYPHVVYRVYDVEGRLLYVGLTGDIVDRVLHLTTVANVLRHPNGHIRRYGARVTVESFPSKAAGRAAEQAAIAAEAPLLNVNHNHGRGLRGAQLRAWVSIHRPTPFDGLLVDHIHLREDVAA